MFYKLWWRLLVKNVPWSISCHLFLSIPPENRKLGISRCFLGVWKKTSGIKWFDVLTTYCISDHTYLITLQIVANRKADNNYISYSIKNLTSSSSHSFGTENDSIKSAPHTSFTSTRIEISKNQLTVVFNRNSAMPCVCS